MFTKPLHPPAGPGTPNALVIHSTFMRVNGADGRALTRADKLKDGTWTVWSNIRGASPGAVFLPDGSFPAPARGHRQPGLTAAAARELLDASFARYQQSNGVTS
jgi:hypothetical protein